MAKIVSLPGTMLSPDVLLAQIAEDKPSAVAICFMVDDIVYTAWSNMPKDRLTFLLNVMTIRVHDTIRESAG